ncbi:MAG: ROK family transcriptional regulator [Sphaerochaeta sp.]|uniref:ROK family transcriptional regulator n=1 Tax=Sphaerochaeta sp. TaxID=1972642 RepID=UPI002FCAA88C
MSHPRRSRVINSSRVIHELWIEDQLSRADLSARLGLTKSSISNIVNTLLEQGIVKENEIIDPGPKGGRRAIGLTLNHAYFHVLGIEIRSDSYTAISVDLEGTVLFSETQPEGCTALTFKHAVVTRIQSLCDQLKGMHRHLLGVGIAFSGVIDAERQMILRSVSLDFQTPFDFGKEVASAFPFPVILENDANCGAWGEVVFQRKRKLRNFMFVLIEFFKRYEVQTELAQPTIGLGFGFDGKIYRGSSSQAGEFKSVFNTDPLSSKQVIIHKNVPITEDGEALRTYMQEICKNLAFLINTLDIGHVFIGGNIEPLQAFVPDMLRSCLQANSLTQSDGDCHIQFSSLGFLAVSFGAAALVLDKVLMNLEPLSEEASETVLPLFHLLS